MAPRTRRTRREGSAPGLLGHPVCAAFTLRGLLLRQATECVGGGGCTQADELKVFVQKVPASAGRAPAWLTYMVVENGLRRGLAARGLGGSPIGFVDLARGLGHAVWSWPNPARARIAACSRSTCTLPDDPCLALMQAVAAWAEDVVMFRVHCLMS